MTNCVWFLSILLLSWLLLSQCTNTEKDRQERLVLHGEPDLAQAFTALQKEVENLKQQVQQIDVLKQQVQQIDVLKQQVQQIDVLKQQVQQIDVLKQQVAHLTSSPSTDTYVRWGRTVCPGNATDLVYNGFAAGNFFNTAGGAADFLCLPSEPKWGVYDDGDQNYAVPIYGAEYQFANSFADGGAKFFGQNLHNHDAPCAVCHTTGSTTLMIPGRNVCYPGWKLEYHGYLVTGRSGDPSATNYICLDSQPETEFGDRNDEDGKLINFVEVACGTLKCPPYVQHRELTCVVCSK